MILEMTDCDANLIQMKRLAILRCKNSCTMKDTIAFNHKKLQQRLNQIQSPVSRDLIAGGLQDLFEGGASVGSVGLVQVPGSEYLKLVNRTPGRTVQNLFQMVEIDDGEQDPVSNKTQFNNPPVPRTEIPMNPCSDPNMGAPSAADKAAAKCTLGKSSCYKLQGRFLEIQAEIADARDELMEQIQHTQGSCEETEKTLGTSIENDEALLDSSQSKLAAATEKESTASEMSRQVSAENQQYNDDLLKQMKTCNNNYMAFENEICALRKIRGDLHKKKVPGHTGFFQDCEVSNWDPE